MEKKKYKPIPTKDRESKRYQYDLDNRNLIVQREFVVRDTRTGKVLLRDSKSKDIKEFKQKHGTLTQTTNTFQSYKTYKTPSNKTDYQTLKNIKSSENTPKQLIISVDGVDKNGNFVHREVGSTLYKRNSQKREKYNEVISKLDEDSDSSASMRNYRIKSISIREIKRKRNPRKY